MEHNENKSITADDICNIIKASKKSGLTKLVFGDLSLEFSTAAIVVERKDTTIPTTEDISQLSFGELGKLDSPGKTEEEDDAIDDMHLAVSDPVAWEIKHLEGHADAATGHNET